MAVKLPDKKRAVVSYENMNPELAEAFEEKYPRGYADYMGDIFMVDKADGTLFHAVSVELPDAIYLVKIKVKTDNYDDVENDFFKDSNEEPESDEGGEFPDNEEGEFPEEVEEQGEDSGEE